MKKGISLIVLVITIIVMIIIAGAIIISLNSSNIIKRADDAVKASDVANLRSALTLEYAEVLNSKYNDGQTVDAAARYQAVLDKAEFAKLKAAGYKVEAATNLAPVLVEPTATTASN